MINTFLENYQSTIISTLDKTQSPFTSYAPFIYKNHCFYIYISDIAKHAQNLQKDNRCSLFFIEDEKEAKNIFARQRVVLQCKATKVKEKIKKENLLAEFETKFGNIMQMLTSMQDFNLYEIKPLKGEAIFGFAQAYDIECLPQLTLKERENQKAHMNK